MCVRGDRVYEGARLCVGGCVTKDVANERV